MHSCDRLRRDHQEIAGVLAAVDGVLLRKQQAIPGQVFAGANEFFTVFVERYHEAKEERALFPVIAAAGILTPESLRALSGEHEEGRRMLQALGPLGGRGDVDPERLHLMGSYVGLQRRHVAFEDTSILPLVEQRLSATEDARMQEAFDAIEHSVVGAGGREVLLALANALTQACGALIAATPPASGALTARQLVRRPAEIVGPEDGLARAAELMESRGVRELAVVENGALVGILTRTDLEPYRGHLEWTRVRTAMTPKPVGVESDASISWVAHLLLATGFNCVPVSDGGRLIGMLRRSDLLQVLHDPPS